MFPLSHMLKSFVRTGTLTVIDAEGKTHIFGGTPGPKVTMRLTDPTLYKSLFFNPELAAGEAYMDGRMSFENSTLRDFLTLFSVNRLSLGSYPLQKVLRKVSRGLKRFQQANPVGKAQQNVAHHYDLGNDFYQLFLDEGMQYSCAYFTSDDDTLEEAQQNKLRLIASKLNLKPGQRVLDIGSGWGDMALYLARMENVDVTGRHAVEGAVRAFEREGQAAWRCRSRPLRAAGLPRGQRDVRPHRLGRHVRARRRPPLRRVLRQGERAADRRRRHAAALHRPHEPARHGEPVAPEVHLPGAYSPALSEVFTAVEQESLWVTDLEFLRLHYAKTLAHWDRRFEANRAEVARMYDERFCRMWEFYLISAEMMFRTGSQLVFHMQLAKKRDAAPIVRDYITDLQRQYLALERERLAAAPK